MKTRLNLKIVPAFFALILAGCAKDLPEHKDIPIPTLSALSIAKTFPENNATGVPLDPEIVITFDQKVDAYSAIPQNFELWSDSGARIGIEKLVSTQFVPHPNDSDFMVSQITVTFKGYLLPFTTYYFLWGQNQSPDTGVDPAALGIRSLFGAEIENGTIRFTTGDTYNSFNSPYLEILSVSPGRILSRGSDFDFNAEIGDLISRSSESSYITVNKRAPIRIQFSEPFVDTASSSDINVNGIRELQPTPIDEFNNIIIMPFSREIQFNQLFNSVQSLDLDGWLSFRDSIQDRLQGKVHSENGRRTLVFELDQNCQGARRCEYPEFPGSAVIVLIHHLHSYLSEKPLPDSLTAVAFGHFPGVNLEEEFGFKFDFDFLQNIGGGS